MKPQWFQILLALASEDLHGIAIQAEVLRRTDGHMRLWPAMLYRSLETLEREGLVRTVPPPAGAPEDDRRRYHTLTAAGRARLAEEAEMLARWVADAEEAAT